MTRRWEFALAVDAKCSDPHCAAHAEDLVVELITQDAEDYALGLAVRGSLTPCHHSAVGPTRRDLPRDETAVTLAEDAVGVTFRLLHDWKTAYEVEDQIRSDLDEVVASIPEDDGALEDQILAALRAVSRRTTTDGEPE